MSDRLGELIDRIAFKYTDATIDHPELLKKDLRLLARTAQAESLEVETDRMELAEEMAERIRDVTTETMEAFGTPRPIPGKEYYAQQLQTYHRVLVVREIDQLRGLLEDLVELNDCRLDHHGYCQAHDWFGDERCPHARAKELLKDNKPGTHSSPETKEMPPHLVQDIHRYLVGVPDIVGSVSRRIRVINDEDTGYTSDGELADAATCKGKLEMIEERAQELTEQLEEHR